MSGVKVAVWGPNRWCNYGDDLQSVLYALHLRSLGYDPIVFQLNARVADEYGFRVADTVDQLLSDVNLCILAGGALLTPQPLHKRVLKSDFREYELDFKDLLVGGRQHKVKFCGISIGGDGRTRNPDVWYSRHRTRFFKSDLFLNGTVRLPGDVLQMKALGKKFTYVPDCILSSNKFLKIDPVSNSDGRIKIGFNFKRRHVPVDFRDAIFKFANESDEFEFYFFTTHMEPVINQGGVTYEFLPKMESKNVYIVPYESPSQQLKEIASMDVFVASKLHLGMTGLLVGTPFISYRGPGKARSFLKSLGADFAIVDDEISFAELVRNYLRTPKDALLRKYDLKALNEAISESQGQFDFCKEVAEKYA